MRQSRKIQLLAAFVVLFICLNAGGAVCVAYCQGFEIRPAIDHPEAQATSTHCNKTKTNIPPSDTITIDSSAECCPMTVSFIGAPIETALLGIEEPVTIAITTLSEPRLDVRHTHTIPRPQTYRGPPVMDRRIERIKHRLLLI